MQPIHKGGKKPKPDPASYKGIYLISALAKLVEGIIIKRLTQYTEQHSTLTDNQLGTRSNCQIHDAIYSIIAIIQHNFFAKGQPTYVAFLDFTTAFPSVFREGLLSTMHERNIVGKMWRVLRLRFDIVEIRVLHPKIRQSSEGKILQGLPEGSRLSPTLFGIVVADLIHELQHRFPNATITHNGNIVWIGEILYVDDLCLISTNAQELQEMIHVCQTWSEKARMQINADKSKIIAFHETAQQRNARQKPMKKGGQIIYPAPFHLLSSFPDKKSEQQQYIDGTALGSLASKGVKCTPLQGVKEFDYFGLRHDDERSKQLHKSEGNERPRPSLRRVLFAPV